MDGKDVCLKVLRIFNDTGKDARRVTSARIASSTDMRLATNPLCRNSIERR